MSKKINIKKSTIIDSNLVVDSPSANSSVAHKGEKFWQNNIFIYVIITIICGIVVGLILFAILGDPKMDENIDEPKINVENSTIENSNLVADSPNSVNIVGDKNVVNKLDLPPPEFKGTIISQNKISEAVYQTKLQLDIISQFQLQKIQIGVIDNNIISIDARKNSMMSVMQGIIQSSSNGRAFISFENATGSYILTIKTKNQDSDLLSKININYQ